MEGQGTAEERVTQAGRGINPKCRLPLLPQDVKPQEGKISNCGIDIVPLIDGASG